MHHQTLIRNSFNSLSLFFNSCSRLPFVGVQRFLSKATTEVKKVPEDNREDDILYKRIQVEVRSGDRAVLDSYEKFVSMAAQGLEINLIRVWEPFRYIKRRTLLRSAFVKKKYRVQYEWRTYFRCMEFKHLTGSTASTFLEYIERNLPEGVIAKVTKERIEALYDTLEPPSKQQQIQ